MTQNCGSSWSAKLELSLGSCMTSLRTFSMGDS